MASERYVAQELDAVDAGMSSARGPVNIFMRLVAHFWGEKIKLRVSLIHQPGFGLRASGFMGKDSGNGEFSSGYPGSSGSVYWAGRPGRGEDILPDGDSVVMLHSSRPLAVAA
jgi:hypothetical protein